MKTSWSRDIVEEKRQQYQGISLKISSCEKEPFREPSMPMERDPRVTTAQQGSKGLILLEKQTAHLSKTLILHAHEIGTFCIDCTGTPYRADGGGILDPTQARFHRDMLFLIGLEDLRICTHLWRHGRGQDCPPVGVLGGAQGRMVHDEAIVDLNWRHLSLRRTAAPGPVLGDTYSFHTIVEGMVAPGVRRAAPPSLPTVFIVGDGRLRVSGTGKPSRFHVLDVLGEPLGFLGLGRGIRHSGLVGQWAGVDHQEAYLGHGEASVSIFHFHLADHTGPVPASRRLLAGAARFFE